MKSNGSKLSSLFTLLALALVLSGCAGTVKNMKSVDATMVSGVPAEGKSAVVFLRPSGMGFAVQSSVFDVTQSDPSLVGIVAAKKKVIYEVEPGEHLFMVIGESADFMSAELEADKTYYALVTPRMGLWKARFSLKPVHAGELESPQFEKWLQSCEWVAKTPDSEQWLAENITMIENKQRKYFQKWMEKNESERPHLYPQDGR